MKVYVGNISRRMTEEQLRSLSYCPYEASAAGKERIAEAWERTVLRDG